MIDGGLEQPSQLDTSQNIHRPTHPPSAPAGQVQKASKHGECANGRSRLAPRKSELPSGAPSSRLEAIAST